jgi:tape measure domain-containing protein
MPLNLGDLQFSLGADTTPLDSAISKLTQFSSQVDAAAKRTSDGSDQVAAAMARQEAAMTSALNKVVTLNAAVSRSGLEGGAQIIQQNVQAYNNYVNALNKANVSAVGFQRANERLNASLTGSRVAFATLNSAAQSGNSAKFTQVLRDMGAAAVLITGPLGGVATRIAAFGAVANSSGLEIAAVVAGVAIAAMAFDKLGKSILSAGVQFEAYRDQLTAVTGSQAAANIALQDAINIANQSGQSINTIVPEYAKFAQVTENTGLAGQKAHDIFLGLSQILTQLHASPEKVTAVMDDFGQMVDRVSLTTSELSRKLDKDLPNAYEAAIAASGMTDAAFTKMLTTGQVVSDAFLPKFIAKLEELNHVNPAQFADTFESSTNRLHNAWLLVTADLDNYLGLSEGAKSATDGLSSAFTYFDINMTKIFQVVGAVVGAVVGLMASTISYTTVLAACSAAVTFLTEGFAALTVAMMANPMGALAGVAIKLVLALGGAAAAYYALKPAVESSIKPSQDLNKEVTDLINNLNGAKQGMMGLGQVELDKITAELALMSDQAMVLSAALATIPAANTVDNRGLGAQMFGGQENQIFHIPNQEYTDKKQQLDALDNAMKQLRQDQTNLTATLQKYNDTQNRSPTKDITKNYSTQTDQLAKLTDEYKSWIAETNAFNSGGLDAFNQLKITDDEQQKLDTYRKTFDQLNKTVGTGSLTFDDFTAAMKAHDKTLIQVKLDTEALKLVQNTLSSAFGNVLDSLNTMVQNGKFSFKALVQAAGTAVSDIIKTFQELAIINPIENSLFGLTGANAKPTLSNLGGLGGGLSSILGSAGSSPASGIGPSMASSGIVGFFSDLFAKGGAFNGGVRFLASGGLLNGPTAFSTNSGIAIGGEAGTEAVMPLSRGADGKLGVKGSIGGKGGGMTNNVTYAIDARGSSPGVEANIIQAIKRLDQSLEKRALRAVQNASNRNPKFLSGSA